jgi:hypothetical protein
MVVKIRLDGKFDIISNKGGNYALDRKTCAAKLRTLGIQCDEFEVGMNLRGEDHNALHFGVNGTFIFSSEYYGMSGVA